jgi:hypothetical protein
MRGKVWCYAYYRGKPLITIGPDYKFTIAEIIMMNMFLYMPMHNLDHSTNNYKCSFLLLLA